MKITINIPKETVDAIIERASNQAEELGRKIKDKQKLVSSVMAEMIANENASYYQSEERIDEWISADSEGEGMFDRIIKRCSTKK